MSIQADDGGGSFTLQLLDSAQGQPVQTWEFTDRGRVSIGRATDNDITITDPQVSRLHLELLYRKGDWWVRSLGRNGTHMDGIAIAEERLVNRTVLQLGAGGPQFRFMNANDSVSNMATVQEIGSDALDFLEIDEDRKVEEVEQIANSEAFQQLEEAARRLRDGEPTDIRDPTP